MYMQWNKGEEQKAASIKWREKYLTSSYILPEFSSRLTQKANSFCSRKYEIYKIRLYFEHLIVLNQWRMWIFQDEF